MKFANYRKTAIILAAISLLAVSAELLLRHFDISGQLGITNMNSMFKTGVFVRDRVLFWKFLPGKKYNKISPHYKGELRINSMGFREREINEKKNSEVYKIFFLGGSNTCGEGIAEEDRFSNILEKKLNDEFKSVRFEVYNFGMPGYSTLQMYRLLENTLMDLNPQMIIVNPEQADGLHLSDEAPFSDSEINIPSPGLFRLICFLEESSYIYRLVRKHTLVFLWNLNGKKGHHKALVRVPLEEHKMNLEKILVLSQKNNIGVIFLTAMGFRNGEILNVDKGYTCEPNIDITYLFKNEAKKDLFLDDGHINAKGHFLVSEILFEYLKTLFHEGHLKTLAQ